jgi:DNA-binding winged helix-turn-helix (wHTH) protein
VHAEESSLCFHNKNLRKVLGDTRLDTRYVANVPGCSYRFVARLERIGSTSGRRHVEQQRPQQGDLAKASRVA